MLQSQTSMALRTSGSGMVTGVEFQPLHYIELIEAGRYCTYKGREDQCGALKDCSKGEAITFLRYICKNDQVNSKDFVTARTKCYSTKDEGSSVDCNYRRY